MFVALDNFSSFIIDPSNNQREPLVQKTAWALTILLGIFTVGIAHGLFALWRKLRHVEKNDTHEKIGNLFRNLFSKKDDQINPTSTNRVITNETNPSSVNPSISQEANSSSVNPSISQEANSSSSVNPSISQETNPSSSSVNASPEESTKPLSTSVPAFYLANIKEFSAETPIVIPTKIEAIPKDFTTSFTILAQRHGHEVAKAYILREAAKMNAEVFFVSPEKETCPENKKESIKQDLNSEVFTWENTSGVQEDIQKDGKIPGQVVLYGVASQFNSAEAPAAYTPEPGKAVNTYKGDNTQGPGAQLQFSAEQVEMINNAANLGYNALCQVLNEDTRAEVAHGYLTPITSDSAKLVIKQLQTKGDKIEYLCMGNVPQGEKNSEKVYEMLVAAPAFGGYYNLKRRDASESEKQKRELQPEEQAEIEFLCSLQAYRAQFKQAIQLADLNPDKQVIFKPIPQGLGVFSNGMENIAKGFYTAAKEYETRLQEKNIRVRLQVYKGGGEGKRMADTLGLKQASVGS